MVMLCGLDSSGFFNWVGKISVSWCFVFYLISIPATMISSVRAWFWKATNTVSPNKTLVKCVQHRWDGKLNRGWSLHPQVNNGWHQVEWGEQGIPGFSTAMVLSTCHSTTNPHLFSIFYFCFCLAPSILPITHNSIKMVSCSPKMSSLPCVL